ncbi:MAG: DinB family protein [Candidatus Sumerlaeaceae bacterium]
MTASLARYCSTAFLQLEELCAIASDESRLRTTARSSQWSVQQHIEHLALAGEVMLTRIESSVGLPPEQQVTKGKLKPIGRLILTLHRIPRGKGKAPDFTLPRGTQTELLRQRLERLKTRIDGVASRLDDVKVSKHRTTHPVLGDFTPSQWLRFLKIHQKHHLDIIQEIEKARYTPT